MVVLEATQTQLLNVEFNHDLQESNAIVVKVQLTVGIGKTSFTVTPS